MSTYFKAQNDNKWCISNYISVFSRNLNSFTFDVIAICSVVETEAITVWEKHNNKLFSSQRRPPCGDPSMYTNVVCIIMSHASLQRKNNATKIKHSYFFITFKYALPLHTCPESNQRLAVWGYYTTHIHLARQRDVYISFLLVGLNISLK